MPPRDCKIGGDWYSSTIPAFLAVVVRKLWQEL
jgi:hypothetical protein